ncbi:MAG: DUF4142 domain-containing protein, partial [Pedobacter sp.]
MKNIQLTVLGAFLLLNFGCSDTEKKAETVSDTTFKTADTVIQKTENATKLDTTEVMFLQNAAYIAINKSESSKRISTSTTEADIEKFAKTTIDDYAATIDQLNKLATQKGYILPKVLPESQLVVIRKMEELKDEARNEYFVKLMLTEQQKAVGVYAEASRTADEEIATYSKSALPTLNAHLKELKRIDSILLIPKA